MTEQEKQTIGKTPEAELTKQRIAINYVPGEPPLEAIVIDVVDDPNRPGQKLFHVIPANPEDAEGFPKVAPQESIVPSRIAMNELGEVVKSVVKPVESEVNPYDHLFDPDKEVDGSVEDAAVRPVESAEDRLTRERRVTDARDAARDAYLMDKTQI